MGKVFIHVTMSLDGFIGRLYGEIEDWAFQYGTDEMVDEVMGGLALSCLGIGHLKAP